MHRQSRDAERFMNQGTCETASCETTSSGGQGSGHPASVGRGEGRLRFQVKADVDEGGWRPLHGWAVGEREAVLAPLLHMLLIELQLRLCGEAVLLLLLLLLCRKKKTC